MRERLNFGSLVAGSISEEDAGDEDGERHEDAEGEGEEAPVPNEVVAL